MQTILQPIVVCLLLASFLYTPVRAQQEGGSIVRTKGGDRLHGEIVERSDSTITLRTAFGDIELLQRGIDTIVSQPRATGAPCQHLLMMTATPAGPGAFAGLYELGYLHAGFGLGDLVTISAGATLIPGVPLKDQYYIVTGRLHLLSGDRFELAIGGAYDFVTLSYPFVHYFAVGTLHLDRSSRLSAMLFGPLSGSTQTPIAITPFGSADTLRFIVHHAQATPGMAIGYDAPAFGREDMSWVAEVWTANVTQLQQSLLMTTLRFGNEHLTAGLGLGISPAPLLLPVVSLVWRM